MQPLNKGILSGYFLTNKSLWSNTTRAISENKIYTKYSYYFDKATEVVTVPSFFFFKKKYFHMQVLFTLHSYKRMNSCMLNCTELECSNSNCFLIIRPKILKTKKNFGKILMLFSTLLYSFYPE